MSMIRINSLCFSYEGSSENIFKDLSLTLDTDWKLGFVGRNGRGKTTLLKEIIASNVVQLAGIFLSNGSNFCR